MMRRVTSAVCPGLKLFSPLRAKAYYAIPKNKSSGCQWNQSRGVSGEPGPGKPEVPESSLPSFKFLAVSISCPGS